MCEDDNFSLKPKWCDGCATGQIEFIDITYADASPDIIKSWAAEPCSQVKKRGKINPDRLHHCVTIYNYGRR